MYQDIFGILKNADGIARFHVLMFVRKVQGIVESVVVKANHARDRPIMNVYQAAAVQAAAVQAAVVQAAAVQAAAVLYVQKKG